MYAYALEEDSNLESLPTQPLQEADQVSTKNNIAKTNSNIILCLGDAVLVKPRAIVNDDNKCAKELGDELNAWLLILVNRQQQTSKTVSKL